jgi:hypothetical protein
MKPFSCLMPVVAYICLVSPAVCLARLGETEEQLERRYGRPVYQTTDKAGMPPGGEKRLNYLKDNITVHVTLHQGRSVAEGYEFKDGSRGALPIEGDVIDTAEAILDASSQGHEWRRHPAPTRINPGMLHVWQRSDGKAGAIVWRNKTNMLELTDMEFMKESNRARKAGASGASGF